MNSEEVRSRRTTSRIIGVDLLRASAALLVVFAHFGFFATYKGYQNPVLLAAAYFGVELFFIISGFLIGGLLLDIIDRQPTAQMWRRFLVRRWMRTVPLYAFWVLVLLILAPPAADITKHALMYLTFTQNLAWPLPSGYWFAVSWTLAVEEWFYLFFSAALIGLAAFKPRTGVVIVCAVFLIVPPLLRIWVLADGADWDSYARRIVVLRLDAIAYGVVLVYLSRTRQEWLSRWRWPLFGLGWFCLLAPLSFGIDVRNANPFVGAMIFTPTLVGFALLFPVMTRIRKMPFRRLVLWVSDRSYALYIVHLSLANMIYGLEGLPPAVYLPLTIGVTLVVSDFCYRWVESPFMRRRPVQFPADRIAPVLTGDGVAALGASGAKTPPASEA